MSIEYERLIRVRDAFGQRFRPLLKDLDFHLSVGISRGGDEFALTVRCLFEDFDSVLDETKTEVLEILGTSFEFEGDTYPLDIAFGSIPIAQQSGEGHFLKCPQCVVELEPVRPKKGQEDQPTTWSCYKCEYEYVEPR